MTYSVWDWNRRQYAVYTDQRPRPLMGDPTPCRPAASPGVGGMIDVGMTLCPLPADAQPLGWSEVAVGQVVRQGGPAPRAQRGGRTPGLGGMLFAPGAGGMGAASGVAPGGGLGFTFAEAVIVNVLVSVAAGVISTFVFKGAFNAAGKPT